MRLSTKARPGAPKFGPLADFARDLAARIQGNMTGRTGTALPARRASSRKVAPRATATQPSRSPRGFFGGGALSSIADHVLALKLPNPMEAIEIALLSQAMTDTDGNITAAARLLGIHRKAVERKLAKHRLATRRLAKQRHAKSQSQKAAKRQVPGRRKRPQARRRAR